MLGVELGDDVDTSAEIHPGFARILPGVITSTRAACGRCGRVRLQRITPGTYVSPLYEVVSSLANLCRPGKVPVDESGNVSAFLTRAPGKPLRAGIGFDLRCRVRDTTKQ